MTQDRICERHLRRPVIGQLPCAGCEIEHLREEIERLAAIVYQLADWSTRWNPSTIYPHGMMERCNRELREIETAAREAAEKARDT